MKSKNNYEKIAVLKLKILNKKEKKKKKLVP
jgi:hypothetical protein